MCVFGKFPYRVRAAGQLFHLHLRRLELHPNRQSNGAYNKRTDPWHNINASETEHIWMHVETSNPETAYVYGYLEIKVPNSST
jgi:hypothetical protein